MAASWSGSGQFFCDRVVARRLVMLLISRTWIVCGLLLVMIAAGACKKSVKSKASVAKGATFSVPVPDGYAVSTDPRFTKGAPGGVVLMADKRAAKGAFLGSIVVTRVPPGPDFDLTKVEVCKEIAGQMARTMPVELKRFGLVETAVGKSCQYEVVDKKVATRGAKGTVM
jgi:hypothetical protein